MSYGPRYDCIAISGYIFPNCEVEHHIDLYTSGHRQSIGTIVLQLQIKADVRQASSKLSDSRRTVEDMHSKLVDTLNIQFPGRSRAPSTHPNAITDEDDRDRPGGLEILDKVQSRMDSLNSGKLKAAFGIMDSAARVRINQMFPMN